MDIKIMRTFFLTNLILFCFIFDNWQYAYGQAPTIDWIMGGQVGGDGHRFDDIVVNEDFIYVTGNLYGTTLSIQDTTLYNTARHPIFGLPYSTPYLAQYTKYGTLNHVIMGVVTDHSEGSELAVDDIGHVYWAGNLGGDTTIFDQDTFRRTTSSSSVFVDLFIIKYNAKRETVWTKTIATGSGYVSGMEVDKEGSIYLTGGFFDYFKVEDRVLFDQSEDVHDSEAFVLKFNAAGELVWSKILSSGWEEDGVTALTLDDMGDIYITGSYAGKCLIVDGDTLTNEMPNGRSANMYVMKLNHDGQLIWMQAGKGNGSERGEAIALDKANNVYVLGKYTGNSISLGDTTLQFNRYAVEDVFLAKYSTNGLFLWARAAEGDIEIIQRDIKITDDGRLYWLGEFRGPDLTIADFNLENTSYFQDTTKRYRDGFLAQLDTSGKVYNIKHIGGSDHDALNAMEVAGNDLYLAGSSDSDDLLGIYDYDWFLAKIALVTTSVVEQSQLEHNITIYPNPSKEGLFYIKNNKLKNNIKNIKVYNEQGMLVKWVSPKIPISTTAPYQLTLSHLPTGLYFLQFTFVNGVYVSKQVVKD